MFVRDERFLSVFEKIFFYKSQNEKRHEWEEMENFYDELVSLICSFPRAHLILKRLFDNAKNMDPYADGFVRCLALRSIFIGFSRSKDGKKVLSDIIENWSHEKMLSLCGSEERVQITKQMALSLHKYKSK